jgi:hypothetical protein
MHMHISKSLIGLRSCPFCCRAPTIVKMHLHRKIGSGARRSCNIQAWIITTITLCKSYTRIGFHNVICSIQNPDSTHMVGAKEFLVRTYLKPVIISRMEGQNLI